MSELRTISLSAIDPNPHRMVATYPLKRRKIDALKESIAQVGLWEGVIVRSRGNRYECAFGHHRLAAAREQLGEEADVTVICRDLDDGEMLQFMGRENGEDYNAEFLIMLETWQAAERFLGRPDGQNRQAIALARFLGWTRLRDGDRAGETKLNDTAEACNAAHKLIAAGHLSRDDLRDLSVKQAREICQATVAHLETIERVAAKQARTAQATGAPPPTAAQVERVKREYASAAKSVASDLRSGSVGTGKARGEIWSRADIRVRDKGLPDFGNAIRGLRRRVEGYFDEDFTTRVKELCAVADQITDEDQRAEYGYLARDIRDAMDRANRSAERLDKAANPAPVTHLRPVTESQA